MRNNNKYKELLDSSQFFKTGIIDEAPIVKVKRILEEYFTLNKDDFNRGVFFGKSIVDEIDLKNAFTDLLIILMPDVDKTLIKSAIDTANFDKQNMQTVVSSLAGFIVGILK